MRQAVARQGRHDALRLRGRHDLVVGTLHDEDGAGDAVGVPVRRPLSVAFGLLRVGTHEDVHVARFELVRDLREGLQVAEPVERGTGREDVPEAERRQGRVAAGAATPDGQPPSVSQALLREPERRVRAVVDIDDAPLLAELVAEGPAVAGGAAVVDVDDREAAAGEGLPLEAQRRARLARGPTVAS